mmetsp:Transcript_67003/g.172549  ORF Transcript_67003/g.172549 Transcript_67003/m.172549 type:complete len:284 (-) Transcript_67003:2901-3752(-)
METCALPCSGLLALRHIAICSQPLLGALDGVATQHSLRLLISVDPLGWRAVHHVVAVQQRDATIHPSGLQDTVSQKLAVLHGEGEPLWVLRLQVLLQVWEEVVRVVTALGRLVVLGALAGVERALASACHPPSVERWQQVVPTGVHCVLVHTCALGAAARAHGRAAADQRPDLVLLLPQGCLQALCHDALHLCFSKFFGNLQRKLLGESCRVLDVKVRHDGEARAEQRHSVASLRSSSCTALSRHLLQRGLEAGELRPPPGLPVAPALDAVRERIEEIPELRR